MQFKTVLQTDLTKPVRVKNLEGNFFSYDVEANAIYVRVTNGGEPVTITDNVVGYVVRGDGYTETVAGTVEDGMAKVVLNSNSYQVTGAISVVVKAGTTTIGAVHGYVYRSRTDQIIDPGHLIPSLDELLQHVADCINATDAANTAKNAANTAAQAANTAASAIQNLSTTAVTGASVGAVVNTVSGHKNIDFTLPVVLPTFAVATGDAGTDVDLDIDTDAPNSQLAPKLTLTIPRGDPGTIANASGTSIPISPTDSTNIKAYIDAATAISTVIDALYPVGSTYISMNDTMPTALTTGRTWEAITGGYVLKTVTTGTGGTLTNAGTTGSTTLTVDQIPSHTHELNYGTGSAANGTGGAYNLYLQGGSSETTKARGGGQGHTHTAGMPKNVAVYMWKRTA